MGFDSERRKNFRAAVVGNCEGTLLFGDAQIRVHVLDESATGFKLSTEDQRSIPASVDALLRMDDGLQHRVRILHVERRGMCQALGIKRYETQERKPGESRSAAKPRQTSVAKALAVLFLVVVSALALQAAPVRNRLAALPLFRALAGARSATSPGAVPSDGSAAPHLDRDRPFEFQRYLEPDVADWLHLAPEQRRTMRGLIEARDGARKSSLAEAQRAVIVFMAQTAVLELFSAEQRSRLEEALGRPLSGSALLQDIVERTAPQAELQELYEQFGALLIAAPPPETQFGVSDEAAATARKRIDEEFQPSSELLRMAQNGADANQIMLAVSLRLEILKEKCLPLLTSSAKPTQ